MRINEKPAWASKTLIINAVALIASIAAAFGLDLGLTAEVQATLVAGAMAVINIVLRLMTDSPVKLK